MSIKRPNDTYVKNLLSRLQFYHFTHIDNLESILQFGLLPRAELRRQNIPFVEFDSRRRDNIFPNGPVCVSVGHPHLSMTRIGNPNDFVVLKIDSGIWEHEIGKAACPTNAASNDVRLVAGNPLAILGLPEKDSFLKEPAAILSLFTDPVFVEYQSGARREYTRASLSSRPGHPNDPQAELQFEDPISPDLIRGVFCPTIEIKRRVDSCASISSRVVSLKPSLFRRRQDAKYWFEKRVDVESSIAFIRSNFTS